MKANVRFVRIIMALALCLMICAAVTAVAECTEHTWKSGKPAACNEMGNRICTVCGVVEEVPGLVHSWKDGKAATCTEPGNKICTLCGAVETIPASGAHVWKDGKAATCTEPGNKICTLCGAVETIPATGAHVWKDGKAPTCQEAGNKICTVCGAVETIPATGAHDWKDGKEATCAAPGSKICTVCGTVEEIPALAHTWKTGVEPTCAKEGNRICTVCGAVEPIGKLLHIEEVLPGKVATCTEAGLTEGRKCTVCGEITKPQIVIGKLLHVIEVIPGKAATCTEDGLTEGQKCTVCGETLVEQVVIVAPGHVMEEIPRIEPTCGVPGESGGWKCAVCGVILEESVVVPELTHSFYKTVVEPTETREGFTRHTCRFCGAEYFSDFVEKINPAIAALPYGGIVTDANAKAIVYDSEINEEKLLTITVAYEAGEEVAAAKLHLTTELLAQLKTEEVTAIEFVNGDIKVKFDLAVFEGAAVAAIFNDVEGAQGYVVVIDPAMEDASKNFVEFYLMREEGDIYLADAITDYCIYKGEEHLK